MSTMPSPTSNRIADDLAEDMRKRILSGEYAGGEKLPEAGIAAEYNVARPTVRAATEILLAQGVLTRQARQRPQVPIIGRDEVSDILGMLTLTERCAVDHVLKKNLDLRPLRDALGGLDCYFLQALVEVSSSPRLIIPHARSTYELQIFKGQASNGVEGGYERFAVSSKDLQQQLLQSLLLQEPKAQIVLEELQEARAQRVGKLIETSMNS